MNDKFHVFYLCDRADWQDYLVKIMQGDRIFVKEPNKTEYTPVYVSDVGYYSAEKYIKVYYRADWVEQCQRNTDNYYILDEEYKANELSGELKEYLNQLKQMNRAELLEEQYQVKRGKDPEKYQLIIHVFRMYLTDFEKEERVRTWAESLKGQEIVLNPRNGKVKIIEAQLNSRKNAAIITVENDIRTHYISYKGE